MDGVSSRHACGLIAKDRRWSEGTLAQHWPSTEVTVPNASGVNVKDNITAVYRFRTIDQSASYQLTATDVIIGCRRGLQSSRETIPLTIFDGDSDIDSVLRGQVLCRSRSRILSPSLAIALPPLVR